MKILFALFLLTNSLSALTLSGVRSEVRQSLKDTGPTSDEYYWSDTYLNAKINIVQDRIAAYCRINETQYSTYTVAEQREYALPTDVLVITRVKYSIISSTNVDSGVYKRLSAVTLGGLDNKVSVNWENTPDGLPTRYYKRAGKIGLYPTPSAVYASTHSVLQVDYVKRPDTLSSDSSVPFDGVSSAYPYHYMIARGVVALCRGVGDNDFYALLEKMRLELAFDPDPYIGEQYIRGN